MTFIELQEGFTPAGHCDGTSNPNCPAVTPVYCGACKDGQTCQTACTLANEATTCAPNGQWCNMGSGGFCENKFPVSTACTEDRQCALGFCEQGYCCNSACARSGSHQNFPAR
jgi:hypothetical protein